MKKVCSGYTNDGMLYMHHLQKLCIQFIRLLQHVQFTSISFLKERLQPCVYHLPIELPRSDEQHKCNGRPKQAHTGHDQKSTVDDISPSINNATLAINYRLVEIETI